jgi:hypothetical protein
MIDAKAGVNRKEVMDVKGVVLICMNVCGGNFE